MLDSFRNHVYGGEKLPWKARPADQIRLNDARTDGVRSDAFHMVSTGDGAEKAYDAVYDAFLVSCK